MQRRRNWIFRMEEMPKPGEIYRNTKNGEDYEIVIISRSTDNPDVKLVTYKSLYPTEDFPEGGEPWTRTLEEFIGLRTLENGDKMQRFWRVK